MFKLIKENQNKLPLIVLVLLIAVGLFYWFQYRPAQIKHDCSWIKMHDKGKPGRPARTESELRDAGLIKDCNFPPSQESWINKMNITAKQLCQQDNQKTINEYKTPVDPVQAKEWWRSASRDEYQFCLNDKGL